MDSLGHDHADGMRPWGSEARGAVAQFAVAVGESKIRAGTNGLSPARHEEIPSS